MAKHLKKIKSINVLGHDYQIRLVDEIKQAPEAGGLCSHPDRIIYISKDCLISKEQSLLYLLHELRHAYQFESGTFQVLGRAGAELDAEGFTSFILSLKKQGVL